MFVDPTHGRLKGYAKYALGAAAGVFALGACNDPVQNTNLRPEGPPEVLAVLVATDPAAQLYESATYCKPGDEKRPTQVGLPDFTLQQICDADPAVAAPMVTTAYPDGWYVRIMFDELLDPDVEELIEILDPDTGEGTDTYSGTIANTQPVILECESVAGGFTEVPYDGYYSPAGNAVTWPLGPALVIKPDEPRAIATNKMCRVTLRETVVDKDGNPVPAEQRVPFAFQIAPIMPILIDPSDESEIDALVLSPGGDNVFVQFNTEVDASSLCDEGTTMDQCEFGFTPVDTGLCNTGGVIGTGSETPCLIGSACAVAGEMCTAQGADFAQDTETEFYFYSNAPVQTEKEYVFAFTQGAKIADRCGVETTFGAPSPDDLTQATYTTNAFDINAVVPGNGDTVSNLRKPELQFNNVVSLASLTNTEYSITPAPTTPSLSTSTGGNIRFAGHYAPATQYTFTLNAGATVTDAFGAVYTNDEAEMISFTTQPIAVTAISPANNGTSVRDPGDPTSISISFNQSMDPATLDATEYTFTSPTPVTFAPAVVSGCGPTSSSCSLVLTSTTSLAPGSYKFTLEMGATVTDVLGNVYTQAADRSVTFTVENSESPVVCL